MTARKRLPFHTGVNEGAGHMDRTGGGVEREETERLRGRGEEMRKDGEEETGMRWRGGVGGLEEMGKGRERQ